MKKAIFINGGLGRQICAIPALEKLYATTDDFIIVVEGTVEAFQGHPYLYRKTYPIWTKNLFEDHLKYCEIVTPEPYRLNSYFNQKSHLIEAFDEIINNTTDHSDLSFPNLYLNKEEEVYAANIINQAKLTTGKNKVVIVQPFGRSVTYENEFLYDKSSRSFSKELYLELTKRLSEYYCVIVMSEFPVTEDKWSFKPANLNIRTYMALIETCNYFIGCDSSGQHMARSFNKPGTVIMGSTFTENVSYQNHFQILEKDQEKMYSPIRITDSVPDIDLADRANDTIMDFSEDEINSMYQKIQIDIEKKTAKDILLPPTQISEKPVQSSCC
jgi:hypothetical protein